MAKFQIPPIETEEEFDRVLARIWELFHSEPGTPESDELRALSAAAQAYDDLHYPMSRPTPLGALEFWVDQRNLTLDDLAPVIGSKELAAAVLEGQQEITLAMAEALYDRLDIDIRELISQETPAAR